MVDVNLNSLPQVEHDVQVMQLIKLCNLSSMVMYLYELLITFGEEVNLIWFGAISPGKTLFILLRYLTLVTILFINIIYNLPEVSPELLVDLCLAWVRFQWIAGSVVGVTAHLTLELRLYAMYNRSKTVLMLLVVSTVAIVAAMLGIFITILKTEGAEFRNYGPAQSQHSCVITNVTHLFQMFWIPILVGEAALLGLAIVKAMQTRGPMLHGWWWCDSASHGFLRFLVRDSVTFFLMVFATFLVTELTWVIGGADYIEVPVGFAITSASIWSQRLLLNIRKRREAPVEDLLITVDDTIPEFENHHIVLETFRKFETRRDDFSPRWR